MGASAYYLEIESPQTWTVLPHAPRPESKPYTIKDEGIHLQTGRGVSFDYSLSSRQAPVYVYRALSAAELEILRTFHQTVCPDGERIPFYFIKDIDNPSNVIYCRKQLGFDPQFVALRTLNGGTEQVWDVTVELEEEITAADVEE